MFQMKTLKTLAHSCHEQVIGPGLQPGQSDLKTWSFKPLPGAVIMNTSWHFPGVLRHSENFLIFHSQTRKKNLSKHDVVTYYISTNTILSKHENTKTKQLHKYQIIVWLPGAPQVGEGAQPLPSEEVRGAPQMQAVLKLDLCQAL